MILNNLIFSPLNWMELAGELSQLDRFDAQWQAIERREQNTLKVLKSIATVRSVGASTRIEGSRLTDKQVELLIENLDINKLTERDEQEVAGYYDVLNFIGESYRDIPMTESSIKHLHNVLLKYSSKDGYHRGNYKINSNRVERSEADGSKTAIFETTAPGWPTQDAMRQLIDWYNNDSTTHALIRTALFVYEFLSIHPFQDGNGRLSRLLATLLLMKNGYVWIEYVSFEHEIEYRKKDYYKNLMDAQRNRPGEDVTAWVHFFLNCLKNIQNQLLQKLKDKEQREGITMREQLIYAIVENNAGISSGEIAKKLRMPGSTVKRILADLVATRNIVVHGAGRGTSYSIATTDLVRRDVAIILTTKNRASEFNLSQPGSFLRIKKIVLTPLFPWKHPDEWATRLSQNGLYITVRAITANGMAVHETYSVFGFNDASHYQPVFTLTSAIVLPDLLKLKGVNSIAYPVKCSIELSGSIENFDFDVMLVTDQS